MARATIGKLSDRVVAQATLLRYNKSIQWFLSCALTALGESLVGDVEAFDDQICRAVDLAWHEGETHCLIGDLLSGLQHRVPSLRHRLHGSWRLHAAWGRLELFPRVLADSNNPDFR